MAGFSQQPGSAPTIRHWPIELSIELHDAKGVKIMSQTEYLERSDTGTVAAPAMEGVRALQTPDASVLITDHGKTTIADQVVAKIIGLAVREIDGVHELIDGNGGALAGLNRLISGRGDRDSAEYGVDLDVEQLEVAVNLRMSTIYGARIPAVTEAVREIIISRVRDLTGLVVKEVNIEVVDLAFPGEAREDAAGADEAVDQRSLPAPDDAAATER
jgi:uncharacterized alkaline shock family protein YloU